MKKLCKDCCYSAPYNDFIPDIPHFCTKDVYRFCEMQRKPKWPIDIIVGACGRRGRWFKRKEENNV